MHSRTNPRLTVLAAAAATAALAVGAAVLSPFSADASSATRPNVVLIVTDDQTLQEMSALPRTRSLIGGAGTTFGRAYASYPLCCPSRATIFSGQYMHNHGVRGNIGPSGGWTKFRDQGTETKALPTWTRDAGYYNVQIGKYMNGYGGEPPPVPVGWDEFYGKLSEYDENVYGSSIYFNYRMREDPPAVGGLPCPTDVPSLPGEPRTCVYGQSDADYQTDVIGRKAVEAIERLGGPGSQPKPFFLSVDFNAPHSPYLPAPRHDGSFAFSPLNTPAGQNEKDIRDKPRFLRRLPTLGKGKLRQIADRRRSRMEMLLSVDEQVNAIVAALQGQGELGKTYVIFTSDNGYFSGEHRIRQGKYLPYEPSSHVPLLIRGPGIPGGGTSQELVSNADLAPTIAEITGSTPKLTQDGRSLLGLAANTGLRSARPILLEGDTGAGIDEDGTEDSSSLDAADLKRLAKYRKKVKKQKRAIRKRCNRLQEQSPKRAQLCFRNGVDNIEQEPTDTTYKLSAPAYASLRTDRYLLTLYATGELELYDMRRDPNQLNSVHRDRRYRNVRKYLLTQLIAYRGCAGQACNAGIALEPKLIKPRKKKRQNPKGDDGSEGGDGAKEPGKRK